MARIFLILAVLSGLVAGYFAFELNGQKQTNIALYHTTDDNLKKTKKTLDETKKDLETTQATLADTQKNLDDTTSKAKSLQEELTGSKAKVSELQQKVEDDEQKLTAAQSEASDLKTKLGDASTAAQEAQSKVAQLEGELRITKDDLAAQKAEVERLQDMKRRAAKGDMPPGIMGQVVSINTNWNFVVLNVGEKQGIVPNGELIIYRNKQFVCKVRVANTELNTCVADILVETEKGSGPQVGDDAMN